MMSGVLVVLMFYSVPKGDTARLGRFRAVRWVAL